MKIILNGDIFYKKNVFKFLTNLNSNIIQNIISIIDYEGNTIITYNCKYNKKIQLDVDKYWFYVTDYNIEHNFMESE